MKKICLLLLLFSPCHIYAQPAPGSLHNKTMILKRFLDQNHYLPVQWNDKTSAILFDKWIEKLDDEKIFLHGQKWLYWRPIKPNWMMNSWAMAGIF
ncbi:MAG: hypothetical protein IPI54_16240 [Chitinophagaceae bacterium]|nr:hypothetical protein [Chitinophagaceae bacterium]